MLPADIGGAFPLSQHSRLTLQIMKKSALYIGIFLPVLFAACSPSGNQSRDAADGHTSENSLDWAGVYAGDGEILSLTTGHAYFLEEKKTADSVTRSEGTFSWDNYVR